MIWKKSRLYRNLPYIELYNSGDLLYLDHKITESHNHRRKKKQRKTLIILIFTRIRVNCTYYYII